MLTIIMRTGHISDWARELHTAGFLPQRWDAWLLASDLADCIIVTTALPKARSPDEKPVNQARGLVRIVRSGDSSPGNWLPTCVPLPVWPGANPKSALVGSPSRCR